MWGWRVRVQALAVVVVVGIAVGGAVASAKPGRSGSNPSVSKAASLCTQGKDLLAAGQSALAAGTLAKALVHERPCAVAALMKLRPAAPAATTSPCVRGDTLRKHHDDAEAKAAYFEALGKKATFTCADAGLEKLDTNSFWDELTTWLARIAALAGAVALAGVLLGILYFLLKAANRGAPQIQIKAFDDSGLELKLGAGFAELVRSDLIAPAAYGPQIDIVTGEAAGTDALDALAAALPDVAKPAAGLLAAARTLSEPKVLTLGGALHPKGFQGFGVSVGMAGAVSYSASCDLWGDDLRIADSDDAADAVHAMAAPAAGYARHVYTEQTKRDPVMGSDPYAFALFRAAQERMAGGEHEQAAALSESALERDSEFTLASGLLGQAYVALGRFDEAIPRLVRAISAV